MARYIPTKDFSSNLVSKYCLNETSGTVVTDYKGTNNGTYNGSTTSQNENGWTYRKFPGSGSNLTFSAHIVPKGKKTVKYRIRMASIPATPQFLICEASSYTEYGLRHYIESASGGSFVFQIYDTADTVGLLNMGCPANLICDGKWHDIMITWDGTLNANGAKFYVDDMINPKVTATAKRTETTTSTYNLTIGSMCGNSSGYPLIADLDEVEFYNDVVTYKDIENNDIYSLQVGQAIKCRFTATTSGTPGVFSELGTTQTDQIGFDGSPTVDGCFWLLHSGYDTRGRLKLVADRNTQNTITWDALDSKGIASGEGLNFLYDLTLPVVSAWNFNEKSGGLSNLINSATATITGTTTGVSGTISYRTFNGTSDYITYNAKVIPTGQKSLRFKIRKSSLPSANQIIFDNCNATETNSGMYGVVDTAGKVTINNLRAVAGDWSSVFGLKTSKSICDNLFHDILLTWDGTTNTNAVKMYIDGVLDVTTTAKSTAENVSTYNLFIGRMAAGTMYFSGDLTIPEIYSELVDPLSILENSTRTLTGGSLLDVLGRNNGTNTRTKIVDGLNGGKAKYFDGASIINFSAGATIPNGKKSIRVVFKRDSGAIPITYERILDQGKSSNAQYITFAFNTYGGLRYEVGNTATPVVCVRLDYNTNLCDGQWHEALLTWNGVVGASTVSLYVDKVLVAQADMTAAEPVFDSTTSFSIGDSRTGTGYLNYTTLDSVEIYSDVINVNKPLKNPVLDGLVRLLTGGTSSVDLDNEWDKIIVANTMNSSIVAGDDNSIWHWSAMASWTSSTPKLGSTNITGATTATAAYRVHRGYKDSWGGLSRYDINQTTVSAATIGYRPVLIFEILNTPPTITLNVGLQKHSKIENLVVYGRIDDVDYVSGDLDQYKVENLTTGIVLKDFDGVGAVAPINLSVQIPFDQSSFASGLNTIKVTAKDRAETSNSATFTVFVSETGFYAYPKAVTTKNIPISAEFSSLMVSSQYSGTMIILYSLDGGTTWNETNVEEIINLINSTNQVKLKFLMDADSVLKAYGIGWL